MNGAAFLYRRAQEVLRLLTPLLGGGTSKLARGLAGRRRAHERLVGWARRERDRERPCVWLHAPSVGEGLQARATLHALRERLPRLQAAYTHFSPSAEVLAAAMPAEVAGYLPWDLERVVGRVLDALAPDALVFTKTEAWPVLVRQAHERGIAVTLVGGTVPPGARRARWPARALLRTTWERLALVCVNADEDGEGFERLGVRKEVIHVTGDPGIDSAARRVATAHPSAPYLAPFLATLRPTVVAGSTWPVDESVLVPALVQVRALVPELRAVFAPHEPTRYHVRELRGLLDSAGFRTGTLSEVEAAGDAVELDAVVVDRVGVLAHLYTVGDAAYVGGGFGRDGLHSVLEPAAAGLPAVFGPRHGNARAADDLLALDAARVASNVQDAAAVLAEWLSDRDRRHYAGKRALGYIERHLGAADRCAALLADLLARPSHRT